MGEIKKRMGGMGEISPPENIFLIFFIFFLDFGFFIYYNAIIKRNGIRENNEFTT